jgi:hypothetical protein
MAPCSHIVLTEGHQYVTVAGELHDSVMPVRADPNELVMVDKNPVGVSGKF